jgi:hypothetical protein
VAAGTDDASPRNVTAKRIPPTLRATRTAFPNDAPDENANLV